MAKRPKRSAFHGKLDATSPWIRCIIGAIVASRRPTRPVRRSALARALVLLKGRQRRPYLP